MKNETLRIAVIALLAVAIAKMVLPRIPSVGPMLAGYL